MNRIDREVTSDAWPDWLTPGWYVAALSRDVGKATLRPVRMADHDFVVYRTASGKVSLLDRYCSHMGASLAAGRVRGENIECPFHRWQYAADGTCARIPNCSKIPAGALVRSYPVIERFGAIWTFLGPRIYYQLPDESSLFDSGTWWCSGVRDLGSVPTTSRDVMENNVDISHYPPVHGAHPDLPEYTISDVDSSIVYHFRLRAISIPGPVGEFIERLGLRNYIPYDGIGTGGIFGPSLWWARVLHGRGHINTQTLTMLQPVAAGETRIYFAVFHEGSKANPLRWLRAQLMHHFAYFVGPRGDAYIWANKIVLDRPVLCATDRAPIMAYRRWWSNLGAATTKPSAEDGVRLDTVLDEAPMSQSMLT